MDMTHREMAVSRLLIERREHEDPDFWYWLRADRSPTKRDANKFMLACILDFQMRAEIVWENARRLAEDVFGDPEELWGAITSVNLDAWMAKRAEYALHRFRIGHRRVWQIGNRIARDYDGDARNIWSNRSIDAARGRLLALGSGEQITQMITGALFDTGLVTGKGDVKADVHVCRVLGRAIQGEALAPGAAVETTRRMHPENPWLLDRPLFTIGKKNCKAHDPVCGQCYLEPLCFYHSRT